MSIRLISGIPGSGKTYYIVYQLLYGDILQNYFVFHNIPELKLDNKHIKYFGEEDPENNIDPEKLFSLSYQKELNAQIKEKYNKNILWIIDECDKHGFGRTTTSIKEWLSLHRHLGQDIYLISQSKWNIARDYMNLIEVEIQGKRGYLFDAFVYSWFANGERISLTRLPKKKDVYNSYRSFYIKELKKGKSKLLYIGALFGLIGVGGMTWFITSGLPDKFRETGSQSVIKDSQNETSENTIQENKKERQDSDLSYAGYDGQDHLLADESGNLFKLNLKENNDALFYLMKTKKGSTVVFYDNKQKKTEYKRKYIKLAPGAIGRESKREREGEKEQEIYREVFINIK